MIVTMRMTITKTTLEKHIATKIDGQTLVFYLIYKITHVKYLQYNNIIMVNIISDYD